MSCWWTLAEFSVHNKKKQSVSTFRTLLFRNLAAGAAAVSVMKALAFCLPAREISKIKPNVIIIKAQAALLGRLVAPLRLMHPTEAYGPEQSAYGSNVRGTEKTNRWFMCFDEATFSIWSHFKRSRSDRDVGFDLGAAPRHGTFNDWAQINIDAKPWPYCNQTEPACSLNW